MTFDHPDIHHNQSHNKLYEAAFAVAALGLGAAAVLASRGRAAEEAAAVAEKALAACANDSGLNVAEIAGEAAGLTQKIPLAESVSNASLVRSSYGIADATGGANLPAIKKLRVETCDFSDSHWLTRGSARLYNKISGSRVVDAGEAMKPAELVEQIKTASVGQPIRNLMIQAHGDADCKFYLWEREFALNEPATVEAFKALSPNLSAKGSRLTFLSCQSGRGEEARGILQQFSNKTGIVTRAFKWNQQRLSEGFGPYIEAIPGQTTPLTGFRFALPPSYCFSAFSVGMSGLTLAGLIAGLVDHASKPQSNH